MRSPFSRSSVQTDADRPKFESLASWIPSSSHWIPSSDFPDSKWAKYARGRLADNVFADIIFKENQARERMIDALKENMKKQRR